MKKINVDKEKCIGCGACVAIDPEHFQFDEDGKSSCLSNEDLESNVLLNAIESCPTSAISIVEEKDTKCDNPNCTCDPCECEECECNDDEVCECKECDCNDDCEESSECEKCKCNPCKCDDCNC